MGRMLNPPKMKKTTKAVKKVTTKRTTRVVTANVPTQNTHLNRPKGRRSS
ncbi:MAG: hypothetical protein KAS32_26340 [Candidatus Peribacteraceae bacterium]|nr:hypothetical protein [Candidatus Peribacteraceae bacterium]